MRNELETDAPLSDAGALRLTTGLLVYLPIFLIGNALSELLRYQGIGIASLFPPYAALTAALVLSRRRDWVWYILADVVFSLALQWSRLGASQLFFAEVADVTQALVATALLRGLFHQRPQLDSISALLRLLVSSVLIAPAVGGALGALNVVWHNPSTPFDTLWVRWVLSDGVTGLTMLPALLLLTPVETRGDRRVSRARIGEGLAVAAALGGACAITWGMGGSAGWRLALGLFAPLPPLIWIALRFGSGATSLALTGVSFALLINADRGVGPLLASPRDESMVFLQLFVILTSLPILCIAAISTARRAIIELHQAILASVHDHFAILDGRGVIVEVNEAWRRFAESPNVEPFHRALVGDNYLDLCRRAAEEGSVTADRKYSGIRDILSRANHRFEMEYTLSPDGDGDRYALSVNFLALAGGGAFVRRSDVTARHKARLQIEEQRRALSHLARVSALGQLSGALAHELNQPLASIGSNAEAARLLIKRRPDDLAQFDEILHDIIQENQRAAEVIRRLRAMLKRGETHLQPLDAGELIREVLELAHAEVVTRRVTVTASLAPDLPPVIGDRVQLQQVLLNLILNACEAMSAMADSRLAVTAAPMPNDTVQISIRDNGPGIPKALMDRLFEPFVTTKTEGLGLGLSISRTIVASHGGRLWAENDIAGGATVHCLLRAARDASPPIEVASSLYTAEHRGR
ncbi:MAG TPA: ATP-binding protein [Gemmatimonadaceae bacterium]|nr:ATP-binding protein [Gemmatimonadaceae bacterium]